MVVPLTLVTLTVHPHARGDDCAAASGVPDVSGFTPTRVGTTLLVALRVARSNGSPPRAWGRLKRGPRRVPGSRFTPTRRGDDV